MNIAAKEHITDLKHVEVSIGPKIIHQFSKEPVQVHIFMLMMMLEVLLHVNQMEISIQDMELYFVNQ